MKNLLAGAAIAFALSAGSALAADLPSRKEAPVYVPPPPPPPMWTGFYGGLNIGGGWSSNGGNNSYLPYADTTYPIGSTPAGAATPNLFFLPGGGTTGNNTGGVVGGGQIGYNYQFNAFVIGAETDFQGTSITGGNQGNYAGLYNSPYPVSNTGLLTPLVTGNGGNLGLPWFGTVRGRVGYLFLPTLLIYGTGGFAYGQVNTFGFTTPTPAGPRAAAWSGCSRRIGRRRRNISLSISPTMERPAARASISAPGSIRSTTSCALA